MTNYPANIKAARLAAGLSQSALAAAAGISQPYLHELETGKKNPFSGPDRLLSRLSAAAGVTVAALRTP